MSPPGDLLAPSAIVFGCAGEVLSADERAFFAEADPLGFILFRRNCQDPARLGALVAALRESVGRADAPVLIDQEGGRVQRLAPPHWIARPPAAAFGLLAARGRPDRAAEAARANARSIAGEIAALGIDVVCAPVLDLPVPGAHGVIGDRAFSGDPEVAAALGRSACEGFLAGGVVPVVKHVPGHGRADADSHLGLPVVDAPLAVLEGSDFAPFRALNDMPWAMTAHVLCRAVDAARPVTVSPEAIGGAVRGTIGFDGFLVSDDVCMAALDGSPARRVRAALDAGCDAVLHCDGDLAHMRAALDGVRPMTDRALSRFAAARARAARPGPADVRALAAFVDRALAGG